MTMWVTTPAVSNGGLILKIGTALLIAFAATFILVHAEVYFSDQLILQDPINNIF